MIPVKQHATLTGLSAILLWSTTIGLLRSITESFGPSGGAAMIYSVCALFLCLARGMPHPRQFPPLYLWLGGLLFVSYEVCLALAIGFATSRRQSLELGMINYLWPCLTIVLAIPLNQQKFRWWLWPGLALSLVGIVWVLKGDNSWSLPHLWLNIQHNPLAYCLAFVAAFFLAMYNNIAKRHAAGASAVTLFFLLTATVLWVQFAWTSSFASMHFSPGVMLEIFFMGGSTALAYSAWEKGIQWGNLTLLATASYFTPVLSTLIGAVWLQLSLPQAFWQGVMMVTSGSLICWWATHTACSSPR